MNITPAQLRYQYERAVGEWSFVHGVESDFGLPPFLRFAIGSKETNLRNGKGDLPPYLDDPRRSTC